MKRVNKILLLLTILLLCFSGCSKNSSVIKIDNVSISYDEYRYFYLNFKKTYPESNDNEIKEKSLEAIKSNVALEKMAKDYSIELSKDDKKQVENYVNNSIESYGGKDNFKTALEESAITEKLFRKFYSLQILESKLREYMYDEANDIIRSDNSTFENDLKKNFASAKQILIKNDEGDSKDANEALANELLIRIKNGEDFDMLANQYSEDSSMDKTIGYYFTKGQLLAEFENAVFSLSPDTLYPEVVISEAGYHIIFRTSMSQDYIDSNYEDLRTAFKARRFNEMRKEKSDSFNVKYSKEFNSLTFE